LPPYCGAAQFDVHATFCQLFAGHEFAHRVLVQIPFGHGWSEQGNQHASPATYRSY
jgi:hypothetical protein